MTIAELHQNEELRRFEFPVCERIAFLAHAGVSPLPRRVAMAMADFAVASTLADQEQAAPAGFLAETRKIAAQFIGAQPEEIAFVGPTSTALSYIAGGVQIKRGQNVLVYHDDYPANVYPWMAMADRGVQVRFLNVRELGRIRLVDVQGQVDEDTALVALASAHFLSGWRLPLEAIGRYLKSKNILFAVDGIQTLGAFPTPLEFVDFLAADTHKWMLGPCGAGILYVRREVQPRLRPIVHGWHNIKCPGFLTQDDIEFRGDARRYEAGTHMLIGIAGLRAALDLLNLYGVPAIASELHRKRAWIVPALQELGFDVLQAEATADYAGGSISFKREGADMAVLYNRLTEAGVVASLRQTPNKYFIVRFSPHFYNTDEEIRKALAALDLD